jgi:hypothetical protein
MNETSLMHPAKRPRQGDRDAQKMGCLQWSAKQAIKRRTAEILKHRRHAAVVVCQCDGARGPVGVKLGFERIFVLKRSTLPSEVSSAATRIVGSKPLLEPR